MPLPIIVAGLLVSLSVGLLLLGLGRVLTVQGEEEQRLLDVVQAQAAAGDSDLAGRPGFLSRIDQLMARRGMAQSIAVDLARADLSLTPAEYLAIRLGIAAAAFALGYALQRSLLGGVLLGLIGVALPQFYLGRRRAQRLHNFDRQLPDVLERLVGSLRSGYGMLQAVEWVGRQMPDPAGAEFDRVVRETQLGRSLPQALDSMVRRIDSDDLALIVTSIQIHQEVGGSLADVLETVAETIRERVRIQRDIRVMTAQQRLSAYILIALPIGLAVFLYIVNPEYESQLFTPGPTLCIPIGAALMMIIGYIVLQRIVKIDV